jgi:uncharacterized membrane protein YidH (DUF202 family)
MTTTAPATRTYEIGAAHPNTPSWLSAVGRIGIVSRGVVYMILAYLALDVAMHGSAPTQTTSTGALRELEARTGGKPLLVALTIGLACYALWRFFNAATTRDGALKRLSSLVVGIVYAGLCTRAVNLVVGGKVGGGVSSNPAPWVATVMRWKVGTLVVEVAGVTLIAAGLALAGYGLFHRYDKNLALEQLRPRWRTFVKVLGALGDLARGFLLALVGVYLIQAGLTSNADQAKSVDQALQTLVHRPFGAVIIGLTAAGLFAFGLFSFADSRLRRL